MNTRRQPSKSLRREEFKESKLFTTEEGHYLMELISIDTRNLMFPDLDTKREKCKDKVMRNTETEQFHKHNNYAKGCNADKNDSR